ncbi:unnamed protein product, partial [marine sediment metagenome]
ELLPTIKFANGYVKADVKASTKVLEQRNLLLCQNLTQVKIFDTHQFHLIFP